MAKKKKSSEFVVPSLAYEPKADPAPELKEDKPTPKRTYKPKITKPAPPAKKRHLSLEVRFSSSDVLFVCTADGSTFKDKALVANLNGVLSSVAALLAAAGAPDEVEAIAEAEFSLPASSNAAALKPAVRQALKDKGF